MKVHVLGCVLAALYLGAGDVSAQERSTDERLRALEARVDSLIAANASADAQTAAELRGQLDAVLRELERLQVGEESADPEVGAFGLAPSASRVYGLARGASLAGYGEFLYENFADQRDDGAPSLLRDRFDALRAIIYVGYRFSDRVLFNSEIEFEHGSTESAGAASVEFAYLDFLLGERAGIRAGLVLVPMGFINEMHEPTTFLTTERPETERAILPSTWRENGVGGFAEFGGFSVRGYLINGFDGVGGGPSNAGGFSASGVRGGRQQGSKALAESVAAVGRIDWTGIPGLLIGASAYGGDAGQGTASTLRENATIGAFTSIYESHVQYRAKGFDFRGLYAVSNVDEVAELNAARGLEGAASIGEKMRGGYVRLGYDVLSASGSMQALIPFVRYERLNTQSRVPVGFTANPANDREIFSVGLAWRPVAGAIVKADFQSRSNGAGTGTDQFNLALGYAF